jgi:hypothetical protein
MERDKRKWNVSSPNLQKNFFLNLQEDKQKALKEK